MLSSCSATMVIANMHGTKLIYLSSPLASTQADQNYLCAEQDSKLCVLCCLHSKGYSLSGADCKLQAFANPFALLEASSISTRDTL